MKKNKIQWMVKVAMLSAIALILMLLEFPIPFIAPSFYEMDFSEVPILVGGFTLGPVAGIAIELLKVILNLLVNGTVTAGVGEFANFLIGVSFVLPSAIIYKRKRTKNGAIAGMVAGGLIMTIVGCFLNAFFLIPAYANAFGMPIETFVNMGREIIPSVDSLWKLVVFCTAPFNLLKAFLMSLITAIIYKPLSPILKIK